MEFKDEVELEKTLVELRASQLHTMAFIEKLNTFLPEDARFNMETAKEVPDKLFKEARSKAIRVALGPQESINVHADTDAIGKELDLLLGPGGFSIAHTRSIFKAHYDGASDGLLSQFHQEADLLLPWRIASPDALVKGKSLVLRHSVSESQWGGSPDGVWDFRKHLIALEKLIRVHLEGADPRTVRGDVLWRFYEDSKGTWDKKTISDPIFASIKLYKNRKLELEMVSGDMARKIAQSLFMAHKGG